MNRPVRRVRRDPPAADRLEIRLPIAAPNATDGIAAEAAAALGEDAPAGSLATPMAAAAVDVTFADLDAAGFPRRLGVFAAPAATDATATASALRRRAGFFAAASGRANGMQARQAPAVRFQQFRQTVFSHIAHVRMVESAAAPATIWSWCAPHCSQNMEDPSAGSLLDVTARRRSRFVPEGYGEAPSCDPRRSYRRDPPVVPARLTLPGPGRTLPVPEPTASTFGDPLADLTSAGPRTEDTGPTPPPSVVGLVRAGTLDAELAATLWVLVEGRVPVVVAGDLETSRARPILDALLDLVDANVARIELAGEGETFDWLPQAPDLGWRRSARSSEARIGPPVTPASAVIFAPDLAPGSPTAVAGEVARTAIRAAAIGYGLFAIVRADGLDTVFATLRRSPFHLTEDEQSRLGVVLVLDSSAVDAVTRVSVAHYVRPVVRDEHGHVQRLGPAVLTAWDPARGQFEHFGWGITPELALRVGRKAGDFEIEVDRRRAAFEATATAPDAPLVTAN